MPGLPLPALSRTGTHCVFYQTFPIIKLYLFVTDKNIQTKTTHFRGIINQESPRECIMFLEKGYTYLSVIHSKSYVN